MHQWLLTALGARDVSLVGLGFGGWIAAEMASLAPTGFRRLVLVGAMGIKPPEGDIADQAIVSISCIRARASTIRRRSSGLRRCQHDQLEAWDIAREMCFRTAWKPYMYSQTTAASAGRRAGAGAGRLGRRRPDRARQRGRAYVARCRGAA